MHKIFRGALLTAAVALSLFALPGCSDSEAAGPVTAPSGQSESIKSHPEENQTQPEQIEKTESEPVQPEEPVANPSKPAEPEEGQSPAAPVSPEPAEEHSKPMAAAGTYDFTMPAPEREAVSNDYFKDAAFIGDSRTDGFLIYSGIGCGKNLTSNGLSIFKLDTKKALKVNGKECTLLEALDQAQYGKVYLSLGINELGFYDDQGFYDSYCRAIDSIRASQPNAVIYIQGLIPVNETRVMETSKREYLENNHLRVYNDLMRKAAQEKNVVFLDLYSEFADENGRLPYDASKDGVHLTGTYCKKWLGYLQTHTVDFDSFSSAAADPA